MRLFSREINENMEVENNKMPKNIKTKPITRCINIRGTICEVLIEDAKFGKVDGKEILLDEVGIESTCNAILKTFANNNSKYNPIPRKITISREEKAIVEKNMDRIKNNKINKESVSVQDNNEKDDFINTYKPRWTMEDIYLEEASKKQILTALTMSKYKEKLFDEWGLKSSVKSGRAVVLNFFGSPGTGKSMTAEAIASYLNREVFSVNYSQLESKYVGETPKNIKKAFERAKENNAVLIFDEADSFLGKRLTNVSQSADYGVNITRSVMLLELENFDGVVIFTTNLISNYDEAFKRRILASVEFKLPDEKGREAIWTFHLPDKLPLDKEINAEFLAKKYDKVSGADIKDIVLYAAVLCLQRNSDSLSIEDFDEGYKYVMNRYKKDGNFEIKTEVITEEQYKREMKELKLDK